jgi:phosphatidylethanolamine/phosphatidyl-N-methylethanolamine N-methyltransferase
VVLERDPDFCRLLRQRFGTLGNFEIIEGDVRDLVKILSYRGIGPADTIVSGLPVPSFPAELQQSLFQAVRQVLKPDGSYNQITELPLVYWRFYRRYFDEVQFVFEPRNLPPAGAYFCRGVKPMP